MEGQDSGDDLLLPEGRSLSGAEGRAAPPTITARDYSRLLSTRYRIDANAYIGVSQTYLAPVLYPLRIEVEGAVTRTYLDRGREFLILETTARDSAGNTLAFSRHTIWMNSGVRHPYENDSPAPRAPWTRPVGEEIVTLERVATLREPPGGYQWGSPHHAGFAREKLGFRGALVLGNTTLCYVGELARRYFGPAWISAGSLDVSFVGGVVAGDSLTAGASPRDSADGRRTIDLWLENHSTGAPAILGTAACSV